MITNHSNTWPWPEESDALIAATQHHTLLLENDIVWVIDMLIPPDEITAVHTHQWPASFYIISWSDFIRYDDKENIVLYSEALPGHICICGIMV